MFTEIAEKLHKKSSLTSCFYEKEQNKTIVKQLTVRYLAQLTDSNALCG